MSVHCQGQGIIVNTCCPSGCVKYHTVGCRIIGSHRYFIGTVFYDLVCLVFKFHTLTILIPSIDIDVFLIACRISVWHGNLRIICSQCCKVCRFRHRNLVYISVFLLCIGCGNDNICGTCLDCCCISNIVLSWIYKQCVRIGRLKLDAVILHLGIVCIQCPEMYIIIAAGCYIMIVLVTGCTVIWHCFRRGKCKVCVVWHTGCLTYKGSASGQYQIRIACTFISQCNRSGIPNSGHINLIILCTVTICNPFRISNISRICCLDINSVCIKNLVFDWCLFSDGHFCCHNSKADRSSHGCGKVICWLSIGNRIGCTVFQLIIGCKKYLCSVIGKYSRLDFHLCTCLGPDRKISCFHKIFGISGIYSRYLVCCHLCNSGHGSCDSNNLAVGNHFISRFGLHGDGISTFFCRSKCTGLCNHGRNIISVSIHSGPDIGADGICRSDTELELIGLSHLIFQDSVIYNGNCFRQYFNLGRLCLDRAHALLPFVNFCSYNYGFILCGCLSPGADCQTVCRCLSAHGCRCFLQLCITFSGAGKAPFYPLPFGKIGYGICIHTLTGAVFIKNRIIFYKFRFCCRICLYWKYRNNHCQRTQYSNQFFALQTHNLSSLSGSLAT